MSDRAASSSDRSSVGDGRENVDDVVFQHLTLQDVKDGVRMFWDPEANQVFYVFAAEYQVTNNNLPTPKQLTTLMQRLGASPDDMPADVYSILLKKTLGALDSRTRSLRAVATNKPDMVQFYDWSASWLLPEWDGDIGTPQGLPPSSYGLRPVIPRRHTLGHKRLIGATINIICKQPKETVNTGQDIDHGQVIEAAANAIQGSDDTNGKGNKDDAQLPAVKLTDDTGDVVESWEVERILDSKPEGRSITMQVKRRGPPYPTWEPASVMCDAPEAVADYGSPNEIMSGMRPAEAELPARDSAPLIAAAAAGSHPSFHHGIGERFSTPASSKPLFELSGSGPAAPSRARHSQVNRPLGLQDDPDAATQAPVPGSRDEVTLNDHARSTSGDQYATILAKEIRDNDLLQQQLDQLQQEIDEENAKMDEILAWGDFYRRLFYLSPTDGIGKDAAHGGASTELLQGPESLPVVQDATFKVSERGRDYPGIQNYVQGQGQGRERSHSRHSDALPNRSLSHHADPSFCSFSSPHVPPKTPYPQPHPLLNLPALPLKASILLPPSRFRFKDKKPMSKPMTPTLGAEEETELDEWLSEIVR